MDDWRAVTATGCIAGGRVNVRQAYQDRNVIDFPNRSHYEHKHEKLKPITAIEQGGATDPWTDSKGLLILHSANCNTSRVHRCSISMFFRS